MSHSKNPKRSQLPAVRRRVSPKLPVTPPARYCPRCKNALSEEPTPYGPLFDCKTCETLLFFDETDERPGQTKGDSPMVIIHIQEGE